MDGQPANAGATQLRAHEVLAHQVFAPPEQQGGGGAP